MKVNKIIVFTTESFPNGMAATNRIISYGKGFIDNGIKTEVICVKRTENRNNIKNYDRKGFFQGIKFTYLSASTIKSNYFLMRRIYNFLSYLSLLFIGFKKINRSTMSIYYSGDPYFLLLIWLINKLKRGLLFKEESEHPNLYLRNSNIVSKFLLKNAHYNLFDGYLLMTKNLISYFDKKYNVPYIHIPMTVELDRFDQKLAKINENNNFIVYTGVLDDNKDGIDILLKAFAEVVRKYNSYKLHLYGNASSEENLQKYYRLVEQLKIVDFVDFKGKVNREVITNIIMEAKILVLPRPDSMQAQHGFPTKLGEYLATGNPTIVTSVGEIPDYLTDNLDCFMAVPGDLKSLENKMLEIIENYPNAKKVGLEGRKIAEKYFNNIIQTKKIITFTENSFD